METDVLITQKARALL